MGAGVTAADPAPSGIPALATEPPVLGLAPTDWERAVVRVEAYLRALGVARPEELGILRERIRQRAEIRAASMPLEDPVEAAIEETAALLDRWLADELGLEQGGAAEPDTLLAARAAVLGGALPGWTARWAGRSEDALAPAIRAARRAPVPERAPLIMEPNPIHLCCYRLRRRLAAALRWLADRAAGRPDAAGHHS